MPKVAPTFALAAAKPLADARIPVGKRMGASVKVVAFGPAIHREIENHKARDDEPKMSLGPIAGQCGERQQQHPDRHAGEASDLHRDAAEARDTIALCCDST